MHPWRRQILYRWVLAVLAVLGLGGYVAYTAMESPPPRFMDRTPKVEPLKLPSSGDLSALDQAVKVVAELSHETPRPVPAPDPDLLDALAVQVAVQEPALEQEEEAREPLPSLGMIFLGDASRFTSLDGRLYSTGVQEIDRNKVSLSARGREETLYWVDPMRVLLTRPESGSKSQDTAPDGEDVQAAERGAGMRGDQAVHPDQAVQEVMPETLRQAVEKEVREAGEQQRTEIEGSQ